MPAWPLLICGRARRSQCATLALLPRWSRAARSVGGSSRQGPSLGVAAPPPRGPQHQLGIKYHGERLAKQGTAASPPSTPSSRCPAGATGRREFASAAAGAAAADDWRGHGQTRRVTMKFAWRVLANPAPQPRPRPPACRHGQPSHSQECRELFPSGNAVLQAGAEFNLQGQ